MEVGMTKKCFKCKEIKLLSEFYKHKQMKDGHLNKCKECAKIDIRKNYFKNHDYYVDYDKKRSQLPHRVEARIKYASENKEKVYQAKKRWDEKNKHKKAAHSKVQKAIIKGIIIKPDECQKCKTISNKIEGHHRDYSKPLDVIWLCKKCHTAEHWS